MEVVVILISRYPDQSRSRRPIFSSESSVINASCYSACCTAAIPIVPVRNREPVELISADPPYSKGAGHSDAASELLSSPFGTVALAADGLLILERAAGSGPVDPQIWSISRAKRYGGTEVLLLSFSPEARMK